MALEDLRKALLIQRTLDAIGDVKITRGGCHPECFPYWIGELVGCGVPLGLVAVPIGKMGINYEDRVPYRCLPYITRHHNASTCCYILKELIEEYESGSLCIHQGVEADG